LQEFQHAPKSIADVLQSYTHRWPGGIPYPHAARFGNANERRAAGKLALVDAPRERSADGIRLKLEKSPVEFSEELGGSVMFLAMPPQHSAPDKSKQQEPGSDAAATPNN